MSLTDTHCHLSDSKFDQDRPEALQRAQAAEVSVLVEIGEKEAQWPKARLLAEQNPGRVFWTAGFHPHYADQAGPDLPGQLKKQLDHPQLVAVGEIGLDYFKNPVPRDIQKRVFSSLLKVAVEANKPAVIHCRDAGPDDPAAQMDMLEILKKVGWGFGVLHCFQGSLEVARQCLEMGFYVGLDGPVTYPNASSLRSVMSQLPLDRIVLETDSPYLPPQAHRGKRNEPAYLPQVAEKLAEIRGSSPAEIHQQTTQNAQNLFRIPPSRS